MLYSKFFKAISPLVPEKKIFEGFYHIWVWWSNWSCNLDGLNIFSFLLNMEALYEILLQLAQSLFEEMSEIAIQ